MALFGKTEKKATPTPAAKESRVAHRDSDSARPVVGREVFCRICDKRQQFSRCWLRVNFEVRCPCCGMAFENPAEPYMKFQAACPQCGENLEQPGFEYGLCDGCGSKYELVPGTKPGLLPNKKQRAEMEKHGKAWMRE